MIISDEERAIDKRILEKIKLISQKEKTAGEMRIEELKQDIIDKLEKMPRKYPRQ